MKRLKNTTKKTKFYLSNFFTYIKKMNSIYDEFHANKNERLIYLTKN